MSLGKSCLFALAAIVLCWTTDSPARAGVVLPTVTARVRSSIGLDLRIHFEDGNAATSDDRGVLAGLFKWQLNSTTGPVSLETYVAGGSTLFHSFCIELAEYIDAGTTYEYDLILPEGGPRPGLATGGIGPGGAAISGPMGSVKANLLRELWGNFAGDLLASSLTLKQQKINTAAFQLAVWEIVHDAGLLLISSSPALTSANGGSFHVAPPVAKKGRFAGQYDPSSPILAAATRAQSWLDLIAPAGQHNGLFEPQLLAMSRFSGDRDGSGTAPFQDQLIQGMTHAPEPTSLVGWCMGLSAAIVLLRRRRRQANGIPVGQ